MRSPKADSSCAAREGGRRTASRLKRTPPPEESGGATGRGRWFPNRRFGLDFGGAPHDSPTRVKVQSWGDRVDHSIDWVDLDGGFTDMMTRLRMLAVYRNRLILLPPSN